MVLKEGFVVHCLRGLLGPGVGSARETPDKMKRGDVGGYHILICSFARLFNFSKH